MQRTHQRINHDHATSEIDIVAMETGQLAPPAAGPRRGDDQQPRDRSAEDTGLLGQPHHAQIRSATARRDRRPQRLRRRTGLNGISRSPAASINSVDRRFSCELTVDGASPARSSS
ncbi:hypothetical protein [Amycolatopsis sp. RTGN1]|uniref:hypothetical protein n=1 Tax=Amycolatopsis ponsaeliensis TaxID=2992142 RepID=UPI00254DE76E|nr:hypothetical protein [Amycolatopsis sp. RTGN1]